MTQRIIKNSIFTGVPFGLFMGLFYAWRQGSTSGLSIGLAGGVFFGVAMAIFAENQRRKMECKDHSFEGEKILLQGPANHFQNGEGKGGWLILTERRLMFRSHGKNLQNQPVDVMVADIASAVPTLTMGFIPNGLSIEKRNGVKARFAVSKRKEWAERIEQLISPEQGDAGTPPFGPNLDH